MYKEFNSFTAVSALQPEVAPLAEQADTAKARTPKPMFAENKINVEVEPQ